MYAYNRTIIEVLRNADEWLAFLEPLIVEQNIGLKSQNCLPLLDSAREELSHPVEYPCIAYLSLNGCHISGHYIYHSQIMELLGLGGLEFNRPAMEFGVSYIPAGAEQSVNGYVRNTQTPEPISSPISPVAAVTVGLDDNVEDREL